MSEAIQPARGKALVNGAELYYEMLGTGHALVLIHEGIADSAMFDDQFSTFAQQYRVVRFDVRGFGQSDLPPTDKPFTLYEDLYGLLTFLGIEKAYVLGMSMGGGMALDFALAYPTMVDALILVAPGISGYDMSAFEEAYESIGDEIVEAAERGDYEQAAELETRIWVDGPERTPHQVNPTVRQRLYEMNLRNFRKMGPAEFPQPLQLDPPAIGRLGEVAVPTCLIIGDKDVYEVIRAIEKLEQGIPGAKKVVIHDAAHATNMERPEEFNRIVLDFLGSL